MAVQTFSVKRELRDLGLFAVVSLLQTYFLCPQCITTRVFTLVSAFTFLIWVVLWKGNSIVANMVSARISWVEFPARRLVVGIMATIAYTLLAVLGLIELYEWAFDFNFGSEYNNVLYTSMGFTIVISLILHSRQFFLAWREARIESERYQRESIVAKYESLKNQVNPHFLFNSLNALTNLVYEDQDKAVKFIKQLSEVYRYVLDTRDRELVSLDEELAFLRAYTYLQQIRFGEKLKVAIDVPVDNKFVAPLALQMLIENAIKHNVVSEDDPLTIRIYTVDSFIVVENNLQRRQASNEPSSGVGLENISKRYAFLTDEKIMISETNDTFKVTLPLLSGKIE